MLEVLTDVTKKEQLVATLTVMGFKHLLHFDPLKSHSKRKQTASEKQRTIFDVKMCLHRVGKIQQRFKTHAVQVVYGQLAEKARTRLQELTEGEDETMLEAVQSTGTATNE